MVNPWPNVANKRRPSVMLKNARYALLGALLLGVAILGIWALSPPEHFQQPLARLQRQSSCVDLPQFGVNTHRGRNLDDVNVRLISDVGARIVRLEIAWIDLERDGQYDFSAFDYLISKLRRDGKSIIFGLAYGHPDHSDGRAANGFPLPPRTSEQRAAYGRYVQAVVRNDIMGQTSCMKSGTNPTSPCSGPPLPMLTLTPNYWPKQH